VGRGGGGGEGVGGGERGGGKGEKGGEGETKEEVKEDVMAVATRVGTMVGEERVDNLAEGETRGEKMAAGWERHQEGKVANSEAMAAEEARMAEAKADSMVEVVKEIEMVEEWEGA